MEAGNPYVQLYVKNNILVGSYRKQLYINLAIARNVVQYRLEFTHGKKTVTMIIARGITGIDKAARDYFSSSEATEGLIASAVVIDSGFQRIIGNFFISVNKTVMPVRLFNSEAVAEKWLQKFIV